MTNEVLRARREAMASPSGSASPMSRRELAQAVNEYIRATTGRAGTLGREQVWRWEQGSTRWPGKTYRKALRAVLGARSDADLGFVPPRRSTKTMDARASETVDVGESETGRGQHMLTAGHELTVRALIRTQGRVLVVRDRDSGRLSLPGGLVGDGVPVQDSLRQHVARQTGLQATVVGFTGAVEHHGSGGEGVRHALTLVFEVQLSASASLTDQPATTTVDDARTLWLTVRDLARYDVRPVVLRDALAEGASGPFWRAWAQ